MSADYFGITACAKANKCDLGEAQRILTAMVQHGAAQWIPGRELIAVQLGNQLQLQLTGRAS